jgi:Protein of unknown function (DUF3093)
VFAERLWAPWWLWAVSTGIAVTLVPAFGVPLGWPAGVAAWLVAEAIIVYVLVSAAVRVEVGPAGLVAGRATLPFAAVGAARALTDSEAALLRGRDANPRAYMLLRPWVLTAVRIDVEDPRDPAPYWYVASRRGSELAAVLERERVHQVPREE